jgi:hypothetical protein
MYQDFSINAVLTDTKTKSIAIAATFDIDQTTVTDSNIQLVDIFNKNNTNITFEVVSKGFVVHLTEWPIPNKEYMIRIQNLKSVTGESLSAGVRRKVTFLSSICSTLEITYPSFNEEISDLKVSWKETPVLVTDTLVNSYLIEISTENAFYNVLRSSEVIGKNSLDLKDLPQGQYYVRGRVQQAGEYGAWSETITFIVKENTNSSPQIPGSTNNDDALEDEDIYKQPIRVVTTPDHGETPSSIIIEFDCEIDPDFLDNIIVIRRSI